MSRKKRPLYVRDAIRIVVAIRDWGPLRYEDLLEDTEVPPRGLTCALGKLEKLGYVQRIGCSRTWKAGPKAEGTCGGLQFFGHLMPPRRN